MENSNIYSLEKINGDTEVRNVERSKGECISEIKKLAGQVNILNLAHPHGDIPLIWSWDLSPIWSKQLSACTMTTRTMMH